MSDHLSEARRIASFAEDVAGSPDDRSVPYLLAGILHALIAVAEGDAAETAAAERSGAHLVVAEVGIEVAGPGSASERLAKVVSVLERHADFA